MKIKQNTVKATKRSVMMLFITLVLVSIQSDVQGQINTRGIMSELRIDEFGNIKCDLMEVEKSSINYLKLRDELMLQGGNPDVMHSKSKDGGAVINVFYYPNPPYSFGIIIPRKPCSLI